MDSDRFVDFMMIMASTAVGNVLWKWCEVMGLTLIDQLRKRTSYLPLQEAADILGVHAMTVRKWVKARKLQGHRIGDEIKIDPSVLADWLCARSI